MKIGYPCINFTLGCRSNRTFRLKSYSEERLIATVQDNLECLSEILKYNVDNNILFFRITSDLVPFASHPICQFSWQDHFKERFKNIGNFIKANDIRISMHPDQFTLINSVDLDVLERSIKELAYHAQVLDLMELDTFAKIQIHVGGVYKDKQKSIVRFMQRFNQLDEILKRRLVIENDDRHYNLGDCLYISSETGIPVLFDVFHHEVNNTGESLKEAFDLFVGTWKEKDGIPMVDYSSQRTGTRPGKHAESIDLADFKDFLKETKLYDFDVMLEIKDKERSAIKALRVALSVLGKEGKQKPQKQICINVEREGEMKKEPICPTCLQKTGEDGHLCVPVKKEDKKCEWCGALIVDERHMCNEKVKEISYICNSCGRRAVRAEQLCNPKKVE